MRLSESAGIRSLYRSSEEMKTSRNQKERRTKAWFKPKRGGERNTVQKDYPIKWPGKPNRREKTDSTGQKPNKEGKPGEGEKILNVETPVFIPFTKESALKKRLQDIDKLIGEATRSPAARFVERCGGATIVDLLGRNNPWAADWCCGRLVCLV